MLYLAKTIDDDDDDDDDDANNVVLSFVWGVLG